MRRYEFIAIVDSSAGEAGGRQAQQSLEGLVEQRGGHIERSYGPKKVRLAYPIGNRMGGFRVEGTFVMPEESVPAFQQALRHQEAIVRPMIVRVDQPSAARVGEIRKGRRMGALAGSVVGRALTGVAASREPYGSAASTAGGRRRSDGFSSTDFDREINEVIERETEVVTAPKEAPKAAPVGPSAGELRQIDEELDTILGS